MLRRGASNLVVQVAQLLALIGTSALLARRAGTVALGTYVLMGTLTSLINLITAAGLPWAAIHHLGRRAHPIQQTAATVLFAGIISAGVSVVVLAVGYLCFEHTFFSAVSQTQLAVTLAVVPAVFLTNVLGSLLLGLSRTLQFALLNFIQAAVTLGVQAAFAVAGGLTATTGLEGWLVGSFLSLVLGVVLVSRRVSVIPRLHIAVLRDLVGYGLKGYIANTLMYFNYRLDSLLVNGFLGVASVGVYAIAVSMAELIWYSANAVSTVLFPHISSVSRTEADRLTPTIVRNVLFVSLCTSLAMFLVGPSIIRIVFGSRMEGAVLPLELLLPGVFVLSAAKVIGSYLSGIGKPLYSTYLAGGTVVLSVCLDLALIPGLGVPGAALASTVVYTTMTVCSIAIFRRESGRRLREILLVAPSDFAGYRDIVRATLHRLAA